MKGTDFKFFPQKVTQSKLFIFDPTNKKMGYEFSHTKDDIYQCLACHLLRKQHKIVTVKLYKTESGEYSVRMRPNQKHACKMRKYQPEKWHVDLVYQPCFQFYLSKDDHLHFVIFTSDDKKLCNEYEKKNSMWFVCKGCKKAAKKPAASAKICKDIDGKECIQLGATEHVCKPVKYADVLKKGIKLVKSSIGNSFVSTEVDESKIFKEFELRMNKAGVPGGRLITICPNDKTQCYEYFYRKASKRYFCCKCITVSVKIVNGKDDKQFAQLGIKEHTCQPIKYEPEKSIIRSPMFQLFQPRNKNSVRKLIIFTTSDRLLCYLYSYNPSRLHYYCQACYRNADKRYVSAKLQKDADGNEYVQQSPLDHVCEPVKFDIKNYV